MGLRVRSPADSVSLHRVYELMEYNRYTGDFIWKVYRPSHGRRIRPGDVVLGNIDRHGYRLIGIDGKLYQHSRLAWFYVHGEWPSGEIDHKDRNTLNNRIDNLRHAPTRDLQRANQKVRKDSLSGAKGVSFVPRKNKWRARLAKRTIGYFDTKETAMTAYAAAAREMYGAFFREN